MIAPQELRLGNFVEYKGYVYRIWSIGNNSTPKGESYYVDLDSTHRHLKGIDLNEISSIELTGEWLLKFGFKLENGNYWHENVSILGLENYYYIHFDGGRIFIRAVNHLQNLYFALVREELTIKEQP